MKPRQPKAKQQTRKPAKSPDKLMKTSRGAKVELTEDELGKVSGGAVSSANKIS